MQLQVGLNQRVCMVASAALSVLLLSCGAPTADHQSTVAVAVNSPADEEAAIHAVIDAYQQAVNDGDARAYAALFAEDALRMPPNAANDSGRSAIQAADEPVYQQWDVSVTMDYLETEVYGDRAHLIADVHGRLTAREGDGQAEFHITSFWLFSRVGGTWQIWRQMWKDTP